jgi:hypothetical protein
MCKMNVKWDVANVLQQKEKEKEQPSSKICKTKLINNNGKIGKGNLSKNS